MVTFFATSLMSWEGAKGSWKPAIARHIDHVGEWGDGGFCSGFFVFQDDSVFVIRVCLD